MSTQCRIVDLDVLKKPRISLPGFEWSIACKPSSIRNVNRL
jgi:hypothetical protein